jgi:hypothetical protein
MASGVLIAESLRSDATIDVPISVGKIERQTPTSISAQQRAAGIPPVWTLLHFEVADDEAGRLADALAAALHDIGWYADLHTAADSFVVFSGRVFRYARGDADGRARAEAHARGAGVPEAQLDWP